MTVPEVGSTPAPLPPTFTEDERAENERLIGDLADLIASGEALALIGAGSSMSADLPSWDGLLSALADAADECAGGFPRETPTNARGFLDYAQRIRDWIVKHGGWKRYETAIGRCFSRTPLLKPFHRDLVRLPFRAFLTTNYDGVLEAALFAEYSAEGEPYSVPIWNGNLPVVRQALRAIAAGGTKRHIIHLHGYYGIVQSIILCREDYREAYGFEDLAQSPANGGGTTTSGTDMRAPDVPRLFLLVAALAATRRLVCIGFSWRDEFFEEILGRVSTSLWEWGSEVHFTIRETSQATKAQDRTSARRLNDKLGILTIYYELAEGENPHAGRESLMMRLRDEVAKRTRKEATSPPAPLMPPPTTPAVAALADSAASAIPAGTTAPAAAPAAQPSLDWVDANNARQRSRIEREH